MTASETIRDFFRRYGAVRCNHQTGAPNWRTADDDTLILWFKSYHSLVVHGLVKTGARDSWGEIFRQATPQERQEASPIFEALKAEVLRRDGIPGASFCIQAIRLVYLPGDKYRKE